MKSKSVAEKSPIDTFKLVLALLVLAAGIVGFYYYQEQPQIYRVGGLLVIALVAIGISMTTVQGRALWGFVQESRVEVRRVVWPTRQETVQTTLVVMVMVVIVAIFLWLLDMGLLAGMNYLLKQGA